MTRGLPLPLVLKEGRALAPIWLAATATVIAGRSAGEFAVALFAFVLGAVALGVYSMGHEYAHRTLTSLLAQPLSRSRLLLSKMTVLATLVALLTLVAAGSLLPVDSFEAWRGNAAAARWWWWMVFLTPTLALFIAPWLTMMSRSVMGGLVFTLAVPAGLWIAGQIARVATIGFTADEFAYGPALTLMIVGLLAVSGVAVVHGRARFIGLEAIDGPREIASAKQSSTRAATDVQSRRRHPVTLLVLKEIRLHGLAGVVAGLYAFAWIAMRLTRMDAFIAGQSFEAITAFYGAFIAMMVGAAASAEERALGTSDWQVLQPWAYWKQWTVKAVTVVIVAVTLGLAVPIILEAAFPLIGDTGHAGLRTLSKLFDYYGYAYGLPLAIPVVALFSLYVSTLCTGGLRALLLALPVSVGLATLYLNLRYLTNGVQRTLILDMYGPTALGPKGLWWQRLPTYTPSDFWTTFFVDRWLSTLGLVGFVLMILAFSLRNSRSAERGTTIARRQLPLLVTYTALAGVISRGVPAYLEWWLLTH